MVTALECYKNIKEHKNPRANKRQREQQQHSAEGKPRQHENAAQSREGKSRGKNHTQAH